MGKARDTEVSKDEQKRMVHSMSTVNLSCIKKINSNKVNVPHSSHQFIRVARNIADSAYS
jgi:hypothetical protein